MDHHEIVFTSLLTYALLISPLFLLSAAAAAYYDDIEALLPSFVQQRLVAQIAI